MEAETVKIKAMKQGRATKVYKMREVIEGKKKETNKLVLYMTSGQKNWWYPIVK